MMTYKQIEASREARLWITQVIMPTLGLATAVVAMSPELRETIKTKFNSTKDKIKLKIHK